MRAIVVVEVLPLLQPLVEELGRVDDHPVEPAIELFAVDSVGSLHLSVEARRERTDVDVADAAVEHMPVELRLELRTVVGLDRFDVERELLQDVVDELDRGLLVEPVVDAKHPELVQSSMAVNW